MERLAGKRMVEDNRWNGGKHWAGGVGNLYGKKCGGQ
jgi:hypothetical protein